MIHLIVLLLSLEQVANTLNTENYDNSQAMIGVFVDLDILSDMVTINISKQECTNTSYYLRTT